MNNEQADEIYAGVVTILLEEGLDWIVREVESVVRAGKTVVSEVPLEGAPGRRTGRARPATVTRHSQRDWAAEERVALLLDAIDAAVCSPIRMESDLVEILPELRGHEIIFAPGGFAEDLPDDLGRERILHVAAREGGDPLFRAYEPYARRLDQRTDERRASAFRLAKLIQDVRKELNADFDS